MTAGVTLCAALACATTPQRPIILEPNPGAPVSDAPVLADADGDGATVDVTLSDGPSAVRASVGDAVVVRVPNGFGPLTLDGAPEALFDPTVDGGVWLVAATKPGIFGIRRAGGADAASLAGVVVVMDRRDKSVTERVLFLDDRAEGSERVDGGVKAER